jgi:hypothetical protein
MITGWPHVVRTRRQVRLAAIASIVCFKKPRLSGLRNQKILPLSPRLLQYQTQQVARGKERCAKTPSQPILVANVYISYSQNDNDSAERIADALRQLKINVLQPRVPLGESIAEAVLHSLDSADVVIPIISRTSYDNPNFVAEVSYALANRRLGRTRVIPVIVDADAKLPFFLSQIASLDLTTPKAEKTNLPRLINAITEPPSLRQFTPTEWPYDKTESGRAQEMAHREDRARAKMLEVQVQLSEKERLEYARSSQKREGFLQASLKNAFVAMGIFLFVATATAFLQQRFQALIDTGKSPRLELFFGLTYIAEFLVCVSYLVFLVVKATKHFYASLTNPSTLANSLDPSATRSVDAKHE